jgi:hypothetical protein
MLLQRFKQFYAIGHYHYRSHQPDQLGDVGFNTISAKTTKANLNESTTHDHFHCTIDPQLWVSGETMEHLQTIQGGEKEDDFYD